MAMSQPTLADLVTPTTITSLLAMIAITALSLTLPRHLLPQSHQKSQTRTLFAWSLFSLITHLSIELPYLYATFTSSSPITSLLSNNPFQPNIPMTAPGVYFLNDPSRLYGAFYGTNWPSKLWQEYARADRRWGGADLTVISLELLTCLVMAPLGIAVCVNLTRGQEKQAWFWAIVVATGELYGGFMTFAPEWLSGSPNLDTSNWIFCWLYLAGLNGLWVVVPAWVLWVGFGVVTGEGATTTMGKVEEAKGKKRE
ncbi:MAG: hypothetical protein Q9159_002967 [Coniocarpon cinnabarinum]